MYTGFPESNYSVKKKYLKRLGIFQPILGQKVKKWDLVKVLNCPQELQKNIPISGMIPVIFVYHLAPKRNMSVKYILSRKYTTGYLYQAVPYTLRRIP